jgi:hypothetical protein
MNKSGGTERRDSTVQHRHRHVLPELGQEHRNAVRSAIGESNASRAGERESLGAVQRNCLHTISVAQRGEYGQSLFKLALAIRWADGPV